MSRSRLSAGVGALLVVTAVQCGLALTTAARPAPSLWSALPAAWAYVVVVCLTDRARPNWETPLSPLNWFLLVFGWQLVAQPVVIGLLGPSQGALPFLPQQEYQELALLAMTGAFLSFVWGLGRRPVQAEGVSWIAPQRAPAVRRLGVIFVAAGFVGLLLRFGRLEDLATYYREPWRAILDAGRAGQTSVLQLLSSLLRPFLVAGVVLLWSHHLGSGRKATPVAITAAITIVLVGSTFNFNRAAMVVPLVAFIGAWGRSTHKLPWMRLAVIGALVAMPAWLIGHLRTRPIAQAGLGAVVSEGLASIGSEIQVYGGAPQFGGFLLEQVEQGAFRGGPSILMNSLLYPVPRLGKRFREESGVAVYNNLIYGSQSGIRDQVVPFVAESVVAGGPLLLLCAFLMVGRAVRWLELTFVRAEDAFDAWAAQYAAIWLSFLLVGSLAAAGQVVLHFGWPLIAYTFARRLHRASAGGAVCASA